MSRSKIKFINEFDGVVSDHAFMAGVYQTVITPPVGFKIFSPEFPEIVSTSVNDDLLAKVVTMSTLESELVLIGLDVWGISDNFEHALRLAINNAVNPKKTLTVCITVTGNGCSPILHKVTTEYETYSEYLIEQIVGSVKYAYTNMKPASIGTKSIKFSNVSTFFDGPHMPGNPALIVTAINDVNNVGIARIINFSCPGNIYRSYGSWTADYPGYTSWALDSSNEGKTIFIQGSSADIRPYDWWLGNENPTHPRRDYSDVIALGLLCATQVTQAVSQTIQRRNVELCSSTDYETGIQISRIGDMYLVSNPQQQNNRFARHIRRDLPNSNVIISTGFRGYSFNDKCRFDAKGRRRSINLLKRFGAN